LRYYCHRPDERFEWCVPIDTGDADSVYRPAYVPVDAPWLEARMTFVPSPEGGSQRADMPWLSSIALVFREDATKRIPKDYLASIGLLRPLVDDSTDEHLWHFSIDDITPGAVDIERSEVSRMKSGRIKSIARAEIVPAVVDGRTIFRIPEDRILFIGEDFVERVTQAGLTGVRFQLLT
jgi:hypothetical protein